MGLEDLTRILDPGPLKLGWGDIAVSKAKRESERRDNPCSGINYGMVRSLGGKIPSIRYGSAKSMTLVCTLQSPQRPRQSDKAIQRAVSMEGTPWKVRKFFSTE